eukprot:CAMPEP_0113533902 /NCGR_PEP_ID=MMETSP0015_2-20120614/4871_1 /TAXON_ID=2838 /ORGANISM="Odontella" /LENGTH=622 /DNA_ID=CAMNT_0000433023 /DNA_START=356 /DNA_END=2221 /DNA_ORIENTATION=+ /assembly_acc=CAM_ASM_000160
MTATMVRPLGRKRPRRYHARALIRSLAFCTVLVGYAAYSYFDVGESESDTARRNLSLEGTSEGTDPCEGVKKASPPWMAVLYFIGVLYLFLGIAIVCDELFVPAIEEMSGDRHLNLSMDVAGATLMAAGGSAPELFTSLFGTFVTEDEVGIGTVVGSAVFNVLFVIAMCALCTSEVLELTWWPLFRDSLYYSIGLVMLGIFVGVISKGEIELWEAIVLFLMYIGYVVIMYFNKKIYKKLTGKELEDSEEEDNGTGEGPFRDENGDAENGHTNGGTERAPSLPEKQRPGTFHTGVLKLLRDPNSWINTAGVGIVAQIAGDVGHVFREVDLDGNGEIDKEELAQLFVKLECDVTADELDEIMKELDADSDGKISEEDFTVWYIRSEERMKSRVKTLFEHFDTDRSGTIDRNKIKLLLETVEPSVTDADVEEAMKAMYQTGSPDEITFEEFSDWYIHSMVYNRQKKEVEEDLEGIFESLKPPEKCGVLACAKYILVLPLVIALAFTVPDVRRPGWHKFCYVAFVMSIVWIGVFSYFMVTWAEIIGNTIGIPPVIMGITLLAAGTSVPDLLSSVIVARMGEGDMAVSSSIGSNIFDILVGLPLPWIIYTAWPTKPDTVTIGSENIW